MNTTLRILAVLAALALGAGLAMAEDKTPEVKTPEVKTTESKAPEKRDGMQLYREMCKDCHGVDADAGEYAPMFLIIEQWERFFDEDYLETHGELTYDDEKKTKVIEAITPEMLELIRKFCVDGAADSEQPMTCG